MSYQPPRVPPPTSSQIGMPPQLNTMPPHLTNQPPPMMPYGYPPSLMPPMGMMMNRPPQMPPNGQNYAMMSAMMSSMKPQSLNLLPMADRPVTTVFVGNISEKVPDQMIRQMLQRCGNVLNWKRVQGTNGKLQGFGFVDYDNPESTLRCIRLLNGYEIAEKKLLVKVDQKTNELLSDHIRKKSGGSAKQPLTKNAKKAAMLRNIGNPNEADNENQNINSQNASSDSSSKQSNLLNLELVDEDTLREDRIVICAFELILKQHSSVLNEQPSAVVAATAPPSTNQQESAETPKKPDSIESDSNKSASASAEQPAQITKDKAAAKKENEMSESRGDRDRGDRERDRDRDRDRDRERDRGDRERDRDRDRDSRGNRNGDSKSSRYNDNENRSPINRHSRSPNDKYSKSRGSDGSTMTSRRKSSSPSSANLTRGDSSSRTSRQAQGDLESSSRDYQSSSHRSSGQQSSNNEESEEVRERKKLERRLREKELAYRERLKNWEAREDKRHKEYAIEKKKEAQRRKLISKEAKKLKQFLEDYDDEKDDVNNYKASNLEKKLKIRDKEIENDNKDRQKEREELEELKKKLIEKGHLDAEIEAKRIQNDENLKMKIKFEKFDETSSSSEEEEDNENDHDQIAPNHGAKQAGEEEEEEQEEDRSKRIDNDDDNNNNQVIERIGQELKKEFVLNESISNININDATTTVSTVAVDVKASQHIFSDNDSNTSDSLLLNKKANEEEYQSSHSILESFNSQVASQLNELNKNNDQMSSSNSPNGYSNSPLSSNNTSVISNLNENSQQSNTDLTKQISNSNLLTTTTTFTGVSATHSVHIKSMKQKPIQPVNQLFAEEDEDHGMSFKKAKLTPSATLSEDRKAQEERKRAVKKLVESIPTDKDELFAYKIDWSQLDQTLMEKRIRPWINKKIIEYIGEEEQSLNDFICKKIEDRTEPTKLLEEVTVILDDEAELFVKKMWRLIVYETESKRCGLSK